MHGDAVDSSRGGIGCSVYPQRFNVHSDCGYRRKVYVHLLLRCSSAFRICSESWAVRALLRFIVRVASMHAVSGLGYSDGVVNGFACLERLMGLFAYTVVFLYCWRSNCSTSSSCLARLHKTKLDDAVCL